MGDIHCPPKYNKIICIKNSQRHNPEKNLSKMKKECDYAK